MLYFNYDNRNKNSLYFEIKAGGSMDELTEVLSKDLNAQLSQLFQYHQTQYTAPTQISGVAKVGLVEHKLLELFQLRDVVEVKEVVSRLGLPNSTVTSAVKRLISKGFITKEVIIEDRRAYQLNLTIRGKNIVGYNRYLKQQLAAQLLDGLESVEEKKQLVDLFNKAVMSLKHVVDDRIRSGYMNALQKEYHGFGPWLIEIKEEEDIPQQFLSQKDRIMNAEYCFKVPVKVDRHRLRPGMLMYSRVVCFNEETLLILEVKQENIISNEIEMSQICFISSSRELLDSHIIIGTHEKTIDIDYNSVSSDICNHLMKLLRDKVFVEESKVDASVIMDKSKVDHMVYNNMLNQIPDHEDLVLLAYQPKLRVERKFGSTAEALLNGHRKYDLQDVMFLGNPKELIVIDSVHDIKTSDEADYSFRYAYIRLDAITRIEMVEDSLVSGVEDMHIHIGECRIEFKVSKTFDSTIIRHYIDI